MQSAAQVYIPSPMTAGADTTAIDRMSCAHPAAAARCTRGAAVRRLMPEKMGGWYAMIRSASHSAASSSTAAVRSIVTSVQLQCGRQKSKWLRWPVCRRFLVELDATDAAC